MKRQIKNFSIVLAFYGACAVMVSLPTWLIK